MTDTKTRILDLAECLTQTNGFNGFSYLDLAEAIGIKAASVHYHFKSKDDLAVALVERVHKTHVTSFQEMDSQLAKPEQRLESIIRHFQHYVEEDKFCLCGMMASELQSISTRVSTRLKQYFRDFEGWLTRQFEQMGRDKANLESIKFLSALEGTVLLARLRAKPEAVYETMIDFI